MIRTKAREGMVAQAQILTAFYFVEQPAIASVEAGGGLHIATGFSDLDSDRSTPHRSGNKRVAVIAHHVAPTQWKRIFLALPPVVSPLS